MDYKLIISILLGVLVILIGALEARQNAQDREQNAAIIRLQKEMSQTTSDVAALSRDEQRNQDGLSYLVKQFVQHLNLHGKPPPAEGPR